MQCSRPTKELNIPTDIGDLTHSDQNPRTPMNCLRQLGMILLATLKPFFFLDFLKVIIFAIEKKL